MNRLSAVYTRIVRTDSWTQTELSCQRADHSIKKYNFGLLEQGHILRCSFKLCQKLEQSPLIGHFNRLVKNFHVRITRNGFVWYTTDTINSMIAVQNVIYKHELENDMFHLIDLYKMIMTKLQEQDMSFTQ
jgi:exosome complex RNA-binding protein Rrp4